MTATHRQHLHIEGLCKRYGETVALQDMTFTVQPGELFGFVGSNGAGKTTTMRIVLRGFQLTPGGSSSGTDRPGCAPAYRLHA